MVEQAVQVVLVEMHLQVPVLAVQVVSVALRARVVRAFQVDL
jgi:hypothetical protein